MSRRSLALLLCLVPSLASADPSAADKKRAGELAAESAKAYKRGELEVSVALLRQAYALYPQPNLLYNLARALEGLGDDQGALDAYTRYLAEGQQIEDRGAIERRIATLQAGLDARAKPVEPEIKPVEPTPPTPEPTPLPEGPPPQAHTDDGPSKLPWLPIIAGVGVLAGGGVFGYLARDREDQASAALIGLDAQRLHDDADRYATYANVMLIGGGALLVGGVVWKLLDRGGSGPSSSAVRASIGPRMVALEWTLP